MLCAGTRRLDALVALRARGSRRRQPEFGESLVQLTEPARRIAACSRMLTLRCCFLFFAAFAVPRPHSTAASRIGVIGSAVATVRFNNSG
jgi:hypothetical protein